MKLKRNLIEEKHKQVKGKGNQVKGKHDQSPGERPLMVRAGALLLCLLCVMSLAFPMFADGASSGSAELQENTTLVSTKEPVKPFEKIIASNGPWYTERLSLEDNSQLMIGYEGTYAIDPSIFARATQMAFEIREDMMLTGVMVPYKVPASGALSFTLQSTAGATFGPFAMTAQSAILVSMDQGASAGDTAAQSLGETIYSYETTKPVKLEKGNYTLTMSDPSGQVRTRQTGPKGAFIIKGIHGPSYETYRGEMDASKEAKKGEKSILGDQFEDNPQGEEKPPIMKQALFVIEKNSVIEEIVINTNNKGAGREPGQVAIFDSKGELLYVEQAQGLPLNDVANGVWAIVPEIVLPPGTYEVGINDPLMFEYEANGNPMFYINVTETKPERTNFTGTYKINMDAYKRSTRMGPVTDNDSDFNLKDFELAILDKGDTLEMIGRYEGMPFSQEVKLSEATGNQVKGVFTFEADLTNLPTKQKITATGMVLVLALDEDNIMFGVQGNGIYERAATKDKGADYNTYEFFVKGKRVTPELPGFVLKALGAAAVVGAGNIPGPANPVQAATGLLFPPLVGVVAHVVTDLIKKAAEKALADKIKAEAARGPKKYTREWYKAQNPNASDETIAMMMLGAAMENTDEPDADPESMSSGDSGDSSDGDSGDSSDGDSGSEGSEGGESEGGDSEGEGSEGDGSEGEGSEGEGSEGEGAEGNADDAGAAEETSRPLTAEDFKSLEEKAADAAAKKGGSGDGQGQGAEGQSGDGGTEEGSGSGSRGLGSGGAKGSDKDSNESQNQEPEVPQSMTVVTGIDGKTSTYEYNSGTGKWVNPETGGEFNESQYNELQKNLPGNQAAQDTERDKIARGDTEQDRQLAKMVADQKEKAYLDKIMKKYGVESRADAEAIITKNMATEQARSEKWQTIGKIAAVGEHVATGVVMGADAALDFLASQTGPAGKVINAGYKITKSIASEVADKGYANSSIKGAAIKGIADAATDFTENKVLKGALTIGGETLGNYTAAKPGEEWDSIADGLVNGTVKVGSGLITDKLAGPGFGDQMSITKLTGGKVRVALNTDGKWMGAVVKASTGQRILDNKVTSQIVQSGTKIGSAALDNYVVKPYFTDSVSEMAKNLPRN